MTNFILKDPIPTIIFGPFVDNKLHLLIGEHPHIHYVSGDLEIGFHDVRIETPQLCIKIKI